MNKEQLELKQKEYTAKYLQAQNTIRELTLLCSKLEGAIEATNNLLKELTDKPDEQDNNV
jgi:hypothetical protein